MDESKQVAHMTLINITYISNRIPQGGHEKNTVHHGEVETGGVSHRAALCLFTHLFIHSFTATWPANKLSCLLSCSPPKLLPRTHCTPECMSSCHKEPNPINQVGAENRRRKCAHVSPPSLNNGQLEAQAVDRTLTHNWALPDGMSRWPLKRLGGPCASCSTSPPWVPRRRTEQVDRIGVSRPGRKVCRLLGKLGVPGRGYPAFHRHGATSVKMHASPEVI